jgi:hypothetical protein
VHFCRSPPGRRARSAPSRRVEQNRNLPPTLVNHTCTHAPKSRAIKILGCQKTPGPIFALADLQRPVDHVTVVRSDPLCRGLLGTVPTHHDRTVPNRLKLMAQPRLATHKVTGPIQQSTGSRLLRCTRDGRDGSTAPDQAQCWHVRTPPGSGCVALAAHWRSGPTGRKVTLNTSITRVTRKHASQRLQCAAILWLPSLEGGHHEDLASSGCHTTTSASHKQPPTVEKTFLGSASAPSISGAGNGRRRTASSFAHRKSAGVSTVPSP